MKLSPNRRNAEKPRSRYLAPGAVILTCLLWGLSVALPVWETRSNQTGEWAVARGYFPAILGWLGILAKCPAWFANLLLIPLSILLFKSRREGFYLSLVALGVAASAYTLPGLYGDNDEAVIVGRLIGYYFWLGSFVIMALAHAFLENGTQLKWIVVRVSVITLMVLGIIGLEKTYPVGVSPLEASLRNPSDLTELTAALARHPTQDDKDAALWWCMRQDLWAGPGVPSKRLTMLMAAGANPNKADKFGDTLLTQVLSSRSSEAFVELLVKAGADVNVRDHRGKTILDIAREVGSSPQCQKVLLDAGARSSGQSGG